jgi:phospholipase C
MRRTPRGPSPALGSTAPGVAVSLAFVLAAVGALSLGVVSKAPPACAPLLSGDALAQSPIHHVFFLIKENHAFENYFGARPGVLGYPPVGSFPVAYGSPQTIAPFPLSVLSTPDLPHDTAAERADIDGGKLDNFVAQARSSGSADPSAAVGYYTSQAIAPYYAYADHYALSDRFFSGVLGPTLPNRIFDLAGTAGNWSTDAVPPPSDVAFPTIFGQLEANGISFAYDYAGNPSLLPPYDLPSVTSDLCQLARIVPVTELPRQLSGPGAPAVTFIDPSHDPLVSEHPAGNVTLGAAWSATVVNTILSSPIGPSSAIFLFFDEAGGFWDPVLPPTVDSAGDGFRVPLLVISPFTPSGVVLHTPLDPAALLRFVDGNWGLPALNARVAGAPALDGFFDFSAPHTPPLLWPSNVSLGAGGTQIGSDAGSHPPPGVPEPGNPASLYLAARTSERTWRTVGSPSTTR